MPSGKLPPLGSSQWDRYVAEYPTCSPERMEEMAKECGFATRHSFQSSMFKTRGIKREKSTVGQLIEQHKERVVSNVPKSLDTGASFKTAAVINDTQNPYQDAKSLSLAESFLADLQPDYLFYNGDHCDFYQISKFDKDPGRVDELQGDINNAKAMFRRHRRALPNTIMILNGGNHEDRWQRFLWTQAKELSSLDCLTIPELFDLNEYGIEYVPYECGTMVNEIFLVIHGDISSVHSGYTAKRMFEKHGGCGVCGHCHRGGSYYKRDRFGTWGWWENFCLCNLYPDWIKNPNWVQGFSLVHFKGQRFWVEQVPIVGHTLMYGGKLYE